jgi:copper chaperone CopZ
MLRYKLTIGLLAVALLTGTTLFSQGGVEREIVASVKGLACPFCAYGIERQLKEIPAVSRVEVSIKTGIVRIFLKPGESVTRHAIEKAVDKAGFTLADLTGLEDSDSPEEIKE